jgi:hypothetical protein
MLIELALAGVLDPVNVIIPLIAVVTTCSVCLLLTSETPREEITCTYRRQPICYGD